MSEISRDAATTELLVAAMAISRRYKLGSVGLISILTDVTHKLADTYCKACERADEERAPEERAPVELDPWAAAQNSAFLIAWHINEANQSTYWVERASKYVYQSGPSWFSDPALPEGCPAVGWKPLENSETAAIISEKARTL